MSEHEPSHGVRVVLPGQHVDVMAKGQARYWTVAGGQVLVAPTLPRLVEALPNPQLDSAALAAMADGRAGIWLSPFDGVERLTFGHRLECTDAGPRVTRWLQPEPAATAGSQTISDPVAVMQHAIAAAVEDATAAHDRATVALSGGLDSTTVLAFAARLERLRPGLRAYCAVAGTAQLLIPRGRLADEWPLAERAAAHVGVGAEPLRNDPSFNWLNACDDFHRRTMMPLPTPANLWWLRALERQAVRNGHRLILTGQSGNATFSNGLPYAPSPLQRDGTWVGPAGVRGLRRRLRGWRRNAFPGVVRPLPVRMPDHVVAMDPWTRWCLAEPPAPAQGPWTGARVEWRDPLGSAHVIAAAMSLPRAAWGTRHSPRLLARQVGTGVLPDEVRLCRERGIQGADFPQHLVANSDSYVEAIDRVRQSPSARQFLDAERLLRATELLDGHLRTAQVFQRTCLKPLAVGLFAAWWDEQGRAMCTS